MKTIAANLESYGLPRRGRWGGTCIVGLLLSGLFGCADTTREVTVTRPARERPRVRPYRPPPRYEPLPELEPLPVARRVTQIGRSVRGKPIQLYTIGHGANPVLIFGGIHGDERNSAEVARRLLAHLQRDGRICERFPVAIITDANPDGLARNSRENVNGVDLNRNFPASNFKASSRHGPRPLSEPESRALYEVVRQLKPRAIVSIHSISGPRQCNNYDGPASSLAELMHRFNRYPVKATIGYPTPGSFGAWAGQDLRIPTITLEMPKTLPGAKGWEQNRDALLAAIQQPARQRAPMGQ